MTIAYWCVLAAALMPYAFAGIAKFGDRRYDNRAPRDFLASLEGRQKRADWAQQNSFEAFPAFAAAVIIAHMAEGSQTAINVLALSFVALRLVYGWAYINDRPTLRSLIWIAALGCVVALFVVAARG